MNQFPLRAKYIQILYVSVHILPHFPHLGNHASNLEFYHKSLTFSSGPLETKRLQRPWESGHNTASLELCAARPLSAVNAKHSSKQAFGKREWVLRP